MPAAGRSDRGYDRASMSEPMGEPLDPPGAAGVPSGTRDAEAIEAELAQHLPGLRAFLRLRMGPELRANESASDLAQSTCRELLEHADRYRHRGEANFRQWLFTTAERKLANRVAYLRAAKREGAREASGPLGRASDDDLARLYQTLSTPSRVAMSRELIEEFERAFDRLDEAHREVVLLSRVVGLAHAEIAVEMGRSEEATRSLLHRALAELSGYLPWTRAGGS